MTYREQVEINDYKVDVRAKLCDYDLSRDYGIGYTAQGDVFYFDKEDYDVIKDLPWHKSYKIDYMYAHVRINGKRPFILMHRLILDAPEGLFVDHIGGNDTRNDNRRCNLRLVTPSQNTINQNRLPRNKYGFVGIRYRYGSWESSIVINKELVCLGHFKTKEEAILVRKEAEEKYYGEFSYANSQEVSKEWRQAYT